MQKLLLRVLLSLALVLALGACSDPRSRAERTLRKVGPRVLRTEAGVLYKDIFAARGADLVVLKRGEWPASFAAFKPVRVSAYTDGFSLALTTNADTETGIYVVPLHMEHTPATTPRASYTPLADGVFWYAFAK